MTKLNSKILEEIFIKSLDKNGLISQNDLIEKFMLCGKEPFKLALNYFSHTESLEFKGPRLYVGVKNKNELKNHLFIIDEKNENSFTLFKSILKIIMLSAKEFNIRIPPKYINLLKEIKNKELKRIIINQKLLNDFDGVIENQRKLESFGLTKVWNKIDLTFMPQNCRELKIFYSDFRTIFIDSKYPKNYFSHVKKLEISGQYANGFMTPLNELARFIYQNFKNITTLTVNFGFLTEKFVDIERIDLKCFELFSKINFCNINFVATHKSKKSFKLDNIDELYGITNLQFDSEKLIISKTLRICDNLEWRIFVYEKNKWNSYVNNLIYGVSDVYNFYL